MATPKAYKVDVTKSIRVGENRDRESIPLEHAYREDAPIQNEEVEAVDYRNVLPTDRGYRSAFNLAPVHLPGGSSTFRYTDSNNLGQAAKEVPKQEVLWVETGSLHRVGIMLGEDGIWLIAPSLNDEYDLSPELDREVYADNWRLILPLVFEQGVRYLWTNCVIDGNLYVYRQGDSQLYLITDYAFTVRDVDHSVAWENEGLQIKVYKTTPSFLNMEGQMGIFRADNRLGFWDSDNAVAWSSALNKLDFTPDVTTFAGVTKYSDVAGVITKVLEHGKGFIIYASRSIVHCEAMPNSPEKWSGRALIQNSGVQFDTQIAVGHPSTTHYAWVDNSMAIITNGQISFSLPEVSDMVNWRSSLVSLKATCSRYLYISLGRLWTGGDYERRARILYTKNDIPFYKVPAYKYEGEPGVPFEDFWSELTWGGLADWPEDEWIEPSEEPETWMPDLKERKPMIPFFSGHKYVTPPNAVRLFDWHKPSPIPLTHPMSPIFSHAYPDMAVSRKDPVKVYVNPGNPNEGVTEAPTQVSASIYVGKFQPEMTVTQWDMTQIDQIGTRFLDKAGDEFMEVVHESITDYLADVDYIYQIFNDIAKQKDTSAVFLDTLSLRVSGMSATPDDGWQADWDAPSASACYTERPESITSTVPDINEAILDAIKADTLDVLPTVEILNLGVVSGIIPLDSHVRVEFDGCKLRMYGRMDKLVGYSVRYVTNETVVQDSNHCLDGLPADPEIPKYSFKWVSLGLTVYGQQTSVFGYRWIPESYIGKTPEEIDWLLNHEDSPLWVPIFEAEISGWGYEDRVSSSWTRYVKTQNVSIFRPCEPRSNGPLYGFIPPNPSVEAPYLNYAEESTAPIPETLPYTWSGSTPISSFEERGQEYYYPDVGPVYANFQKGTKHPYYPTYEWALVYDHLLKKWGSLNTAHQLVYSSFPVNSNTQVQTSGVLDIWGDPSRNGWQPMLSAGIIPVFITPDFSDWDWEYQWDRLRQWNYSNWDNELLSAHLLPCGLSAAGSNGFIRYTKIGAQRAGYTLFTGITANLKGVGTYGGMGVEMASSLFNFGVNTDPEADYNEAPARTQLQRWVSEENYNRPLSDLEEPVRQLGRWASVAFYGSFDLTGLTVYGKPVGRVRYFAPYVARQPEV